VQTTLIPFAFPFSGVLPEQPVSAVVCIIINISEIAINRFTLSSVIFDINLAQNKVAVNNKQRLKLSRYRKRRGLKRFGTNQSKANPNQGSVFVLLKGDNRPSGAAIMPNLRV